MQQETLCDSYFASLCNTYLSYFQYDCALFFAERAYYEHPVEENLQLIGECYLRMGKFKQAYLVLQNAQSLTNRYLLATCCMKLGKYTEAETALLPGQYVPPISVSTTNMSTVPDEVVQNVAGGTAGVLLLGQICRHEHRKDSAVAYFRKCLELDPFCWTAVVQLGEMGVTPPLISLFSGQGRADKDGPASMSTGLGHGKGLGLASVEDCIAIANHRAPAGIPPVAPFNAPTQETSSHAEKEQQQHPLSRINSGFSCASATSTATAALESAQRTMEQRKLVEGCVTDFSAGSPQSQGYGTNFSAGSGGDAANGTPGAAGLGENGCYTPRVALSLGLSSLSLRAPLPTASAMLHPHIASAMGPPHSGPGGFALGSGVSGNGDTLYLNHVTHTGLSSAGRPTAVHVRTSASNISDDFVLSRRALGGRSNSATSDRDGADSSGNVAAMGPGHVRINNQLFTGSTIPDTNDSLGVSDVSLSASLGCDSALAMSAPTHSHTGTQSHRGQQLFATPGVTPIAMVGPDDTGLYSGANTAHTTGGDCVMYSGANTAHTTGGDCVMYSGANTAHTTGDVAPYMNAYSRIEPNSNTSTGVKMGVGGFDSSVPGTGGSFDITQLGASAGGPGEGNAGRGDRPPRVSFGPTARLSFGSSSSSMTGSGFKDDELRGLDKSEEVIIQPSKSRRSESNTMVPTQAQPVDDESYAGTVERHRLSSASGANSMGYTAGGQHSPELRKLNLNHIQHPNMSPVSNDGNAHENTVGSSGAAVAVARRTVHLSPMTKQKLQDAGKMKQGVPGGGIGSLKVGAKENQQNGIGIGGGNHQHAQPQPHSQPQPQQLSVRDFHIEQRAAALFILFGAACGHLKAYECSECIAIAHALPKKHFNSGLVHNYLGLSYYELNEYKLCVLSLKEMNRTECYRVQGLEILSTALWHLKRDKELCSLAHQITELDKFAPETWCVVGNSFSLQHEPETAIKFFQRALQLDPHFSYAHTLCGHEYVANEDLEKGVSNFRHAIRCDERHYNAWYGLGSVYYRQERLDLAEYHFRRATSINKMSSVLQCYMGMVLHAQNNMASGGEDEEDQQSTGYNLAREEEAFGILRNASHRDPKNPQLHFQMVHVLLSLDSATSLESDNDFEIGNHTDVVEYKAEVAAYLDIHPYLQEAIYELHLLEELVPKESPIFSLLGQIYQHKLNNTKLAAKYYNIAIDLDPKEFITLKEILNDLEEPYTVHSLAEDD